MDINKQFKTNLLSLKCCTTHCSEFRTGNVNANFNVCYNNHQTTNTAHTKFWMLISHDTLSWKYHIGRVTSKMISVSFATRLLQSISFQKTLRIIYCSYIHSIMICKRKRPNLHIIRTVRTGKIWRRVESYHAYVPSSKRVLGNARGSLLVTDYNGHTI